jgi:hypothetical protein
VLIAWIGAANKLSALFHAHTEVNKAESLEQKKDA